MMRRNLATVSALMLVTLTQVRQVSSAGSVSGDDKRVPQAFPDPRTAEEYCDRGWQYYLAHDFAPAKADFDKAISLEPDSVRANLSRARANLALNDYQGAISDATRVLKLAPTDPTKADALHVRGMAYAHLRPPERALDDYTASLAIRHSAPVYQSRGLLQLFSFHNYAAALDDYTKCLEAVDAIRPPTAEPLGRATCHLGRGRALARTGETDAAITELQTAKQLYSDGGKPEDAELVSRELAALRAPASPSAAR